MKTETALTFEAYGGDDTLGTYVCHSGSGKTYRVHLGEPGAHCTCPGFAHNWKRPNFAGCRHIRAARAAGLKARTYEYAPERSRLDAVLNAARPSLY